MDSARPGWRTPWVAQPAGTPPPAKPENGSILFHCHWQSAPAPSGPLVRSLCDWRQRLHQQHWIGVNPQGIGFGNLSARPSGAVPFFISGTATGRLETLQPRHFTAVTQWDYADNSLHCRGPCKASSESLSHAAVYECVPQAGAVIHIHDAEMWEQWRGQAPTTDPRAQAGTPDMAEAIQNLLRNPEASGFFVMGGHQDGLMSWGRNLHEAGQQLFQHRV